MKLKKYTDTEIKNIIHLIELNKTPKEISIAVNRNIPGITFLLYAFKAWKKGGKASKSYTPYFKLFNKATSAHSSFNGNAQIIHNTPITNNAPTKEETTPPIDQVYVRMEKAEEEWKNSIIAFIEYEAEKRSKEKVSDMKRRYETELARLQAILIEAQQSSIIGVLKKKFEN